MPTVGVIKPSTRPGRAEELAAMLPEAIKLEHASCKVSRGTRAELEGAIDDFATKVGEMATRGVDLIHPAGVPFLLLGYDGERDLVRRWERQHRIPVFTNGMSQVNALNAFKARRIVAASYFPGELNVSFARYLAQAGFDVLEAAGMDIDFADVPRLDATVIRRFLSALCLRNRETDALYLIGPAWRATLDMIDELEQSFGIPVIHHVPAQSWEIQKRLGFRQPVFGYGRLIREMP